MFKGITDCWQFICANNYFLCCLGGLLLCKTTLGLGKNHSFFHWCKSLCLHKVSPISEMFSNPTAAVRSLAVAWSEHHASTGPICYPTKGLTLALKKTNGISPLLSAEESRSCLKFLIQFFQQNLTLFWILLKPPAASKSVRDMQCKATAMQLNVQYNMSERNIDFSQNMKTTKAGKHFSMTLAFCTNNLMFMSQLTFLMLFWRHLSSFSKDSDISCSMEAI